MLANHTDLRTHNVAPLRRAHRHAPGAGVYGTDKLAKFFGVSKATVWDWCQRGKLPGFKIGKEWRVRVADLQKMIDRKIKTRAENSASRLF